MEIKVINQDNIGKWAKAKGIEEPNWHDLTDEQFSEINELYECSWSFDSLEDFVSAFNRDDNECPVPSCHFIRVFND